MNPYLASALDLASRGFWVFPLKRNDRTPLHTGWQDEATRDPETITALWRRDYNIGIFTEKFWDDGLALLAVDIDVKKGKKGYESLLALELDGCDFPATLEHETTTQGRHLMMTTPVAVPPSAEKLGEGLDIRSRGSYVVGPGSTIDGVPYRQISASSELAQAPEWLVTRMSQGKTLGPIDRTPLEGIDPERARARAIEWLKVAPRAVQNSAGDTTTYKVAARLKDLGCDQDLTLELLAEIWNPECQPPWDDEDLAKKVRNAFEFGANPQGASAPEAVFDGVPVVRAPRPEGSDDDYDPDFGDEGDDTPAEEGPDHPVHALNKEYAFVRTPTCILQETTDADGVFITQRLTLGEFHGWFENQPFQVGNQRPKPVSQHWMESSQRRQFEGVVFWPERDPGPRWYNLWRGFAFEPVDVANHPALDMFIEHVRDNICNGDKDQFNWVMGWFAHMIQKPWEKPLVAMVLKGLKGCGKNAPLERVGALLGPNFMVADDDRYLLGNFNAHLEQNLFFVLDEASWAGDKKAEGRLKGLITGSKHTIERKNKEPYQVDNLCRIAILSNEDWAIPATQDERRFAVFNVGNGRLQDRAFFIAMKKGMEDGGYAHLLRYLRDFDLSQVDINQAPKTEGLVQQQVANLQPIAEWWYDCLCGHEISGGDWAGEWPENVPTNRLHAAYLRWHKDKNIRGRSASKNAFGIALAKLAPSIKRARVRPESPKDASYEYRFPALDSLRADFSTYIHGDVKWLD